MDTGYEKGRISGTTLIYTPELLFRSAAECGLGDKEYINDLLLEAVPLKERQRLQQQLLPSTLTEQQTLGLEGATTATTTNTTTTTTGGENWWDVDLYAAAKLQTDLVPHQTKPRFADTILLKNSWSYSCFEFVMVIDLV